MAEDTKENLFPRLVISKGQWKGTVFPLEEGENLIGRWDPPSGSFPEIDLDSYDPEAKVSRRHALIIADKEKILIKDLGSLNGTYINKHTKLVPDTEYQVYHGDEIIIGKLFLRLETKEETDEEPSL